MRKKLFIVILILMAFSVNSQIVQSNCTALDSLGSTYFEDAQRLTIRKIHRQSLTYKDSVIIPQNHVDTVFKALVAVYNATSLHARDTVVSLLNIHTFYDNVMNRFVVAADSTLPWMHQLKAGYIPTGNVIVDDLISKYNLTDYSYNTFHNQYSYHQILFRSNINYNLLALTALFRDIPQVQYSMPNSYIGAGNNITDSIYADHVELTYNFSWGDCMSGCMYQRFWKFKVYFDCSVEYVGSYGSSLNFLKVIESDKQQISVYPNPFSNKIIVQGIDEPFEYSLINIAGQHLINGIAIDGIIDNLENLNENIYFLSIKAKEGTSKFKIHREN